MVVEYNEQYGSIKVNKLEPKERFLFKVKFTEPKEKVIPAGVSSRTGQPYDSFKTYSLMVEHPQKRRSGVDKPEYETTWFLSTTTGMNQQIEYYEQGDWVVIEKKPVDGKIRYVLSKANNADYAGLLKAVAPGINSSVAEQDVADTLAELGVVDFEVSQIIGKL